MWDWIWDNSMWLVPLVIFLGDFIVSQTKTEVDNDFWKSISYIIRKVFGYNNLDKNGNPRPIYSCEEDKPKAIKHLDRFVDGVKSKIKKKK